MLTIRPSYPDEFDRLSAILKYAHRESRFRRYDLDLDKCRQLFDQQFVDGSIICFFALLDEELIGFGGFLVTPHFFGNDLVASDFMVYVAPNHRGSSAFYRMLKAYEKWAISLNVVEISLGISTGVRVAETSKLYERLGYKREAINFRKDGHPNEFQ